MRARWTATALVLLGGLLAGCQVAVTGTAGLSDADRQLATERAQQQAAVDAALQSLEQAPALQYDATLKDGAGNPATLTYRVARDGNGFGALPLEGKSVRITEPDGQLYLAADADYWKSHGLEENSTQFGDGWVHTVGSELPVDPAARMAPPKLAGELRKALGGLGSGAPQKQKLPDGTEVYDLGGALQVTAAEPHRVTGFAPALLDPRGGPKLGAAFRVRPLNASEIKQFHTDFDGAIDAIGQPFDGLAQASVTVLNDKLDCQDYVGSCKTTVDVSNSVVGNQPGSKPSVHIKLSVEISADTLGSQTCATEGDADADATITMSCSVKFTLPNRTASYQVLAKPTAVAEVRSPVDANAVKAKLATAFAALGG
ncbi:hypothetical protein [Amycolatopsis echigonensis]|nr:MULTISPECIES: hypothetical protein [Amycolatopsis]